MPGPSGVSGPGVGLVSGGSGPGGVPGPGGACSHGGAWWRHPRTATAAGGTHPGMHSCFHDARTRIKLQCR